MEKEIKNLLNKIAADFDGQGSPCKWTKKIKQQLVILGQEYGCKVASSSDGADYNEWLYDLTWWRHQNNNENDMTSIELAVESEWSGIQRERENDFLKLVYAKAKLKLFVFGSDSQEGHEEILIRLKELTNMCEDKNHDKYLFSCTVRDCGEKFIHEIFTTT